MNKDYVVMSMMLVGSILGLWIFVPRTKLREALFSFLVAQLFSWPISLLNVKYGLREFPIRLFSEATSSNFILAYVMYPVIFVIFQIKYPETKSKLFKVVYFMLFVIGGTGLDYLIAAKTNLLTYRNWHWYWNIPVLSITYLVSRIYILWFFDKFKYIKSCGVKNVH